MAARLLGRTGGSSGISGISGGGGGGSSFLSRAASRGSVCRDYNGDSDAGGKAIRNLSQGSGCIVFGATGCGVSTMATSYLAGVTAEVPCEQRSRLC